MFGAPSRRVGLLGASGLGLLKLARRQSVGRGLSSQPIDPLLREPRLPLQVLRLGRGIVGGAPLLPPRRLDPPSIEDAAMFLRRIEGRCPLPQQPRLPP